jgi:hypothetical protein
MAKRRINHSHVMPNTDYTPKLGFDDGSQVVSGYYGVRAESGLATRR